MYVNFTLVYFQKKQKNICIYYYIILCDGFNFDEFVHNINENERFFFEGSIILWGS